MLINGSPNLQSNCKLPNYAIGAVRTISSKLKQLNVHNKSPISTLEVVFG